MRFNKFKLLAPLLFVFTCQTQSFAMDEGKDLPRITDLIVRWNANDLDLNFIAINSTGLMDSNLNGEIVFEINQLVQKIQFENGIASYPNELKSGQFFYIQSKDTNTSFSKFYFILSGSVINKVIPIPIWLLWFIPLVLLLLFYILRKLIILVFILIFFALFYWGGVNFSEFFDIIGNGISNFFN